MSSPSGSGRGRGGGGRGRQKSSWAAVAGRAGSPGSRAGAARDGKGQAANKSLSTKKVESTTTALALGIIKDQLVEADAEQQLLDQPGEATAEQVRDWIEARQVAEEVVLATQRRSATYWVVFQCTPPRGPAGAVCLSREKRDSDPGRERIGRWRPACFSSIPTVGRVMVGLAPAGAGVPFH